MEPRFPGSPERSLGPTVTGPSLLLDILKCYVPGAFTFLHSVRHDQIPYDPVQIVCDPFNNAEVYSVNY
jgi:hypothetical protein